jgi:hypothetical protein
VRRAGYAPWSRKVAGDTNVALTAKWPTRKHDVEPSPARATDDVRVYDPFSH